MILDATLCGTPSTLSVFRLIRIGIIIIKIIIPIILIVSVMIDFVKEVVGNKPDFSDIGGLVVKKIIAAVAIFLIPTAIEIVAHINGLNTKNIFSCINNATVENIEAMQEDYAQKLLDNIVASYDPTLYNDARTAIGKVKNDLIRKQMILKLNNAKYAYEQKLKEEEEARNSNNGLPSNGSNYAIINKYVKAAYNIANNEKIGYCNCNGNCNYCSGGNQMMPDVDCGSFVSFALQEVGLLPRGVIFEPGTIQEIMAVIGGYGFKQYDFNVNSLQYGDILVCNGRHTEIYVGNNQTIGAHDFYDNPEPGDQTGKEVSVVSLRTDGYWTHIVRYEGSKLNE